MFVAIKDKLQIGAPVIVAGSWGSELFRRGVRLYRRLWTAPASTGAPDVVADVVRDYAQAGADVILANTFSTGPLLMSELGLLDEMREWDHAAVRIARETLAAMPDCPAALAGSFSVFGAERVDTDHAACDMTEREMKPLFEAKVETLVRAGCEMIYMERIGGLCRAQLAVETAVASGLPVWVELAVARAADGSLHGAGATGWLLADMVASLMNTGAEVCLVNHHDPLVLAEAIQTIKSAWAGPIGVSLSNGHCRMPEWIQGEFSPEDFVIEAQRWRRQKASVFCASSGAGPEFVAALRKSFSEG